MNELKDVKKVANIIQIIVYLRGSNEGRFFIRPTIRFKITDVSVKYLVILFMSLTKKILKVTKV